MYGLLLTKKVKVVDTMIVLHELSAAERNKPWIQRYIREIFHRDAVSQDAAWKSRRLKVTHIFFRNTATGKIERVRGYSVKYESMQRYAQKCLDDDHDRVLIGMWVNHMLRKNHSKGRIPVVMPINILKLYVGAC